MSYDICRNLYIHTGQSYVSDGVKLAMAMEWEPDENSNYVWSAIKTLGIAGPRDTPEYMNPFPLIHFTGWTNENDSLEQLGILKFCFSRYKTDGRFAGDVKSRFDPRNWHFLEKYERFSRN